MIDHISLRVVDLTRAKEWYVQALAPLGYEVIMEFPEAVGMGVKGKPDLWLTPGGVEGATTHLAFRVRDNATVDAFHAAALAAGGGDNGGPGLREAYHPRYYGAFVLDPDGNNVEAVCHGEEPAAKPAAAKKRPAARKKPAKPTPRTKKAKPAKPARQKKKRR